MAEHEDRAADAEWGTTVAKWTLILTVILAALYVGAVLVYVR